MSGFQCRVSAPNFGAKEEMAQSRADPGNSENHRSRISEASSERFPVKHADFEAMSGVLKLGSFFFDRALRMIFRRWMASS